MVIVNESVEKKISTKLTEELKNAGLTSVKESHCQRYLTKLISAKQEKAQVGFMTVFVLKRVVFISNIISVNLLFIETTLLSAQETINEIFFYSSDNFIIISEVVPGFPLNKQNQSWYLPSNLNNIHFQKNGAGKDDLTQTELQKYVDLVNKEVEEEQACKEDLSLMFLGTIASYDMIAM